MIPKIAWVIRESSVFWEDGGSKSATFGRNLADLFREAYIINVVTPRFQDPSPNVQGQHFEDNHERGTTIGGDPLRSDVFKKPGMGFF